MSVSSVKSAINKAMANDPSKTIDQAEAKAILNAAGSTVSKKEQEAIVDGFMQPGVNASNEAVSFINEKLGTIQNNRAYIKQVNDTVKRQAPKLDAEETMLMSVGVETKTFGGTVIPEAVKEIINQARAAGVEPYDVRALEKNPQLDDHGSGEYTVRGVFSPYPQETRAIGTMAFDYTEITPDKIKKDMETETTYKQLTGYKSETYTDPRSGKTESYQVPQYKDVTAKGSGNISSHYDEASHSEMFARGQSGNKYANNYAILADGTLHALPAMRRTSTNPNLILTNPSLARGKRMLFNGHIEMRGGVITSIGMSGRIHKAAAKAEHKFIDPIPLLKAWGFEMSPNLHVRFEGSAAAPKRDDVNHVLG